MKATLKLTIALGISTYANLLAATTQLRIVGPLEATLLKCTGGYQVRAYQSQTQVALKVNTLVTLTANRVVKFFADSECSQPVTSAIVPAGTRTKNFYLKSQVLGVVELKAVAVGFFSKTFLLSVLSAVKPTPLPTATPVPTGIPVPTATPLPTTVPVPTPTPTPVVSNSPSGYYVLTPTMGNPASSSTEFKVPADVLTNDKIAGVVIRVAWSEVNPEKGKFVWTKVDNAIAQVAPKKRFKLKIMTGVLDPAWLKNEGVQYYTFANDNPQSFHPDPSYSMPVPWDATMLSYYRLLLQEAAKKYDGHPYLDLFTLGGPTRFSLEMHLPKETASLLGYSPKALIDAWSSVSRAFADAFRLTPGGIDVANPIGANDGIAAAVCEQHVRALGRRGVLQMDALNAKDQSGYNIYNLIDQYSDVTVTGFEQVTSSGDSRYGGSFATSLTKARAAGASFIDYYSGDTKYITEPY